jgi:hypothetical protein
LTAQRKTKVIKRTTTKQTWRPYHSIRVSGQKNCVHYSVQNLETSW